jgi:hypothetical protein
MAKIIPTLSYLEEGLDILRSFTTVVHDYRDLEDQCFDAWVELQAASLVLDRWRDKWDAHDRHPNVYYEVFFGEVNPDT